MAKISKRTSERRRTAGSLDAVVGTLVRKLKKWRKETAANEKEMAAGRMYKRAIQCQVQAETLTTVIKLLENTKRSNAALSEAAGKERPNEKPA